MAAGLDRTASVATILAHLESRSSAINRAGMARFGIDTAKAFGVSNAELRPLARQLGKDHARAQALWETGSREARLLACFTDEPKKVTAAQAHNWAGDFTSWEMVDQSSDLFVEAGLLDELVPDFAADGREFVRRTAFSMLAVGAVHLKNRPDSDLLAYLPLIGTHSTDPRNFVKKAVNWALRQIGKRSRKCHGPALELAERLARSPDKAARWTGKDAVKELNSGAVMQRLERKAQKEKQS